MRAPARNRPKFVLPARTDLKRQFQRLAGTWKEETQFLSSAADIAMHPAYQRIIGMGKEALPLILADLRKEPAHWFWALWAITGEDPVPAADKGRVPAMREAWLRWAEKNRLIPSHDR